MQHDVTDADSALALGSGDVLVLATPRLVAWLEAATLESAAAYLEPGQTSVGTSIRIAHLRATGIGGRIDCTVTAASRRDRTLTFSVRATDQDGESVAEGEIERLVVDREKFLSRVRPSAPRR